VRFLKDLQASFPDETLRRHPTDAGLSRAVSAAIGLLRGKMGRQSRAPGTR
jgi:hypothetical protein